MSVITVLAWTLPCLWLILGTIARFGPHRGRWDGSASAASLGGVALAAGLGAVVFTQGAQTTPLLGAAGLGAALRLDALSVTILVMVSLLAVVILRFSSTYLEGDVRRGTFLRRLLRTIGAVELLVLSGNLGLFVAAWIATSLSLHQLLLFNFDRRGAILAARKKFISARIGDVSLTGAAALLYTRFGTGDMATIFSQAESAELGWMTGAAALLIAVAALFKSAQFPTHGWLVEVMETPTPVSALLHAGILNAGPFLVIRFASVMAPSDPASLLLVAVGGFTALFASVVLLTQPSVKVALGYSSAAHMGFMLLVCGLGVYPAAVLHLVAHSFYKAHAFLSSGSAVEQARAKRIAAPERTRSAPRIIASLAVAALLYVGCALALGLDPTQSPALLAVGAILVLGITQLLAPALDARGTGAGLARVAALAAAVTLAFFTLEEGARLLLEGALPAQQAPTLVVIGLAAAVIGAFAVAILLQILPLRPESRLRRAAYVHLRNGLYANAMFDRMVGALR